MLPLHIINHRHRRTFYLRCAQQRLFDFAQLNTIAINFDLIVFTSLINQRIRSDGVANITAAIANHHPIGIFKVGGGRLLRRIDIALRH